MVLAGYKKVTHASQLDEVLSLADDNPILAEAYAEATAALLSLRAEDVGWSLLNSIENDTDGFSLENLKEIAEQAEFQTTGNPLLKRGLTLRTENVFGKGINFDGIIAARFQTIMSDPTNINTLFSADAWGRNERELFTCGNLFMAYRISTKTFFPLPFAEIGEVARNPDFNDEPWYYQRSWVETDPKTNKPKNTPTVEWYPVLEKWEKRSKSPLLKFIADHRVNADVVIIDVRVNTKIGRVWGVPDVLPAMPYAWAHSEYIRDASKLLKALATIAWKVVAKNKAAAQNAAGKVNTQKHAGSTAVMTDTTDLVSMPRSGQVNMRDGQAIAGYVASALGVSLIALLSDPGTASGSYGAAATLDGPSANSARTRQALWLNFYTRVLRAMGSKDGITVSFPKLSEDPVFRQIQTASLARTTGALWADEYRSFVLSTMDITSTHNTPPPTEDFAQAQNALGYISALAAQEQAAQAAQAAQTGGNDPNNSQGNSGVAGDTSYGDNSARTADAKTGTA